MIILLFILATIFLVVFFGTLMIGMPIAVALAIRHGYREYKRKMMLKNK